MMHKMQIDHESSASSQVILPLIFENSSITRSSHHHHHQQQKTQRDRSRFFFKLRQNKKQNRLQQGPLRIHTDHQRHAHNIEKHIHEKNREIKLITAIVGSSIARNISIKNIENEQNEVRLQFKSGSDCADALAWLQSPDGQTHIRGAHQLIFIIGTNDLHRVGAYQTVQRIDHTVSTVRNLYPGHIEEDSSDDRSMGEVVENKLGEQQVQEKTGDEEIVWNKVSRKQFLSAVNDLGSDTKELINETWRLNDFTRSDKSVFGRLLSKFKINQTVNIRHSLYNFWRRNHQKFADDLSVNPINSVEEENKLDGKSEAEFSLSESKMQPLASIASIPYPKTRATHQHQPNLPPLPPLPPIIEASFILTSKQWKEIYDRHIRDMKLGWTDMLYNKVCSCNFHCHLIFKHHHFALEDTRKINSCFFRCTAICKSSSCVRTFEIFIKDEPISKESVIARIRAVGDEDHSADDKAFARKLTGKNRMDVGRAANEIGCLKVFQQKVLNASEDMLRARNFTGCETQEVVKHAAADYRNVYQLDEDIFRDCRIRQQLLEDVDVISTKIKGYVQVMGEKPFRLHLVTQAQVVRFITYCAKSVYSHIYIDATESIVKDLPHQKKIFLYAAVFKDGLDPTNVIPLGHAILADHTAISISYFIGNLRQYTVTIVDKVIRPSFFVTDFSPAIFNAILQTFNHEDIRSHLKRCWNVLLRKYDAKELRSLSFLRICCSHMMHAFARSLSAAHVEKGIRKNILHVFALFINCGELEIAFKFFKRILHLFGNPQATDTTNILQAFLEAPYDNDDIPEKIGPCDFEMEEDLTDLLDEVDENMHSSKAIIHESPFNVEAIRRFPQLTDLLDSKKKYENVTNPLFCRRVIYVFYKWFAYLPLWTSLLTEFEDRYATDRTPVDLQKYEHGRLSNAQVESYFRILKGSILERKTNLRPAEVIVELYRSIQAQLKADKFGVSQLVKNRKGKPKDMNVEESWGKKRAQKKQRNVYFTRIDKYEKKRLASKSVNLKPKAATPLRKPINSKPKSISPKSEPVVTELQSNYFDPFSPITNNIMSKSSPILNKITHTALPYNSGDFSVSKPAESFCGTSIFNEKDFSNHTSTLPISGRSVSPPNIFSGIKTESSHNALPSSKQIKTQVITIEQCSLIWPTFGINNKAFEGTVLILCLVLKNIDCLFSGRTYSVTNTCNIDSPLFAIYVTFRTESAIQNIILNSENEPFLSLRKTFALVESDGWDEARLYWLTTHNILIHQKSNKYNIYGSIDANVSCFIKNPVQLYKNMSVCSRQDCPKRERLATSSDLTIENCETSISTFLNATTSRCGEFAKNVDEITFKEAIKLGYVSHIRQIKNIHTNTIEKETGWLCNGEVITEPSYFVHGPPPFLFVDIVHPTIIDMNSEGIVQVDLNFHDIQRNITVGSSM
ncbi:unnamed protein product [Adineta steineri]|uniref:Uncharacterized protein n=2 Tax=Adineta steineri TaxID=433720 RepID=A0A815Q814_9BILA|nr:unnamed protein product [Adineta steineri]